MARPTKLTSNLAVEICIRIRVGCFPAVAAESCGVGRSTFYRWMQWGKGNRSAKMFREFREQVLQSGAEARVLAECTVFKTDPLAWLRSGPGREDWGDKAVGPLVEIHNTFNAPPAAPLPVGNMGDALRAMEELGLIRLTDAGKAAFSTTELEESNSEDNS